MRLNKKNTRIINREHPHYGTMTVLVGKDSGKVYGEWLGVLSHEDCLKAMKRAASWS